MHRQCTSNSDPLLLASGKIARICILFSCQPYLCKQSARSARGHVSWFVFDVDRTFHHVFQRCSVREKVESLEHHCDLFTNRGHMVTGLINSLTIDFDVAGIVCFQPVDTSQQRRLSRTRSSNDADYLALCNIKGYAVEHEIAAERFAYVVYRNHVRPNLFSSRPTIMISGMHSNK